MMRSQLRNMYEFGEFRLDAAECVLLRRGVPVPLTLKAFETLFVLVSRNGLLVEKDELLKEVWPNTFVEEATLAQNIFTNVSTVEIAEPTEPSFPGVSVQRCN